jgi:hypothetical protein
LEEKHKISPAPKSKGNPKGGVSTGPNSLELNTIDMEIYESNNNTLSWVAV